MNYKIQLPNLIACLISFNSHIANSQELIRSYVTKKSVLITTIEPDSSNYSDLQPIGDAIGNDRVVMLGEQAHGDAPTFLAKTRLIKYLHEKKGFNVLAFESDFFGLNDGWDHLDKHKDHINDFIIRNIYGIWAICNSCSNLFYKYIPQSYESKTPLVITGIDNQFNMEHSATYLKVKLDSFLKSQNLSAEQINMGNMAYQKIVEWNKSLPTNRDEVNQFYNDLQSLKIQLVKGDCKDQFWLLMLDNLISQLEGINLKLAGEYPENLRDIQMAKNLKWLIENKYKGQKIIVWAASMHIAKSLKNVRDSLIKTEDPMGGHLVESLSKGDNAYILGFTSYQGTSGRIGREPYSVHISNQNSFEGWIHAKNYKYAFVDFSKFNLLYPNSNDIFYMAPLGHEIVEGDWNRAFDGIFYIQDMYPCVSIRHHP